MPTWFFFHASSLAFAGPGDFPFSMSPFFFWSDSRGDQAQCFLRKSRTALKPSFCTTFLSASHGLRACSASMYGPHPPFEAWFPRWRLFSHLSCGVRSSPASQSYIDSSAIVLPSRLPPPKIFFLLIGKGGCSLFFNRPRMYSFFRLTRIRGPPPPPSHALLFPPLRHTNPSSENARSFFVFRSAGFFEWLSPPCF